MVHNRTDVLCTTRHGTWMTACDDVDDSLLSVDEHPPSVDRSGPSVDMPEINMLRCELPLHHYILWFRA